jgi:nucleoside triphosphate diphosphatase
MMAETSHGEGIAALLEVMRRLRDPVSGCSWDREQDYASIIPYTLEEAFEVADAVERADLAALRDELGDLLFQVVFLARIAEEQGAFDFDAVAAGIAAKLVRRHPHVFAGASHADAQAQTADWEHRKAVERAARGETGVLAGVARSLPALTRACKIGKRAGRVGFDWPGAAGVREKLAEELAEVDVAAQADPASADTFEELGDLLFVIANWARHLGHDPEAALRAATSKFERRFAHIEAATAASAEPLETLSAQRWEALWQAAKRAERGL